MTEIFKGEREKRKRAMSLPENTTTSPRLESNEKPNQAHQSSKPDATSATQETDPEPLPDDPDASKH